MRRIYIFILFCLLAARSGYCQSYFVTHVTGDVRFNNKPLKLHDKLENTNHLTSTGENAEVCLFSAKRGKLKRSFKNGKKVVVNGPGKEHSELYELTVGDFLLDYNYNKILTARGDFDLFTFFNSPNMEKGNNKILLIEGQALPVKSAKLNTQLTDKFFLCVINGKDTLCNPIKRTDNELFFDDDLTEKIIAENNKNSGQTPGIMKIGYIEKNDYREQYFPKPVFVTFLKKADLKVLVDLFKQGLSTRYHNSSDQLADDIEDHLAYCYGDFYQPAIRKLILADLN